MTRRGRRRLAVCALLVVPVVACGSGEGDRPSARAAPPAAAPTIARPVADAAAVVDRGTDYVAIARSLLLFGRRLEVDCPNAALVDRAYAPGSKVARGMVAVCHAMHREQRYIVEVDRAPLELTVLSTRGNVVSFRLVENLARRELVDRRGRVLERVGPATERYIVSMLRFSPRDPWRLDFVHRLEPRVEVRL